LRRWTNLGQGRNHCAPVVFQERMSHARRLSVPLLAAVLLLVPAGAASATTGVTLQATAAAKRAPLLAKLESCSTANGSRAATFKGVMPAVRKFRGRMEMRFELFQRPLPDGRWSQISGVDSFDEWDLSDPGISSFIVKKKVLSLPAGAAYRARIGYRWRDAGGKIRRTLTKLTAGCVQPGTLPDLVLLDPSITPADRGDAVVYRVKVRNLGPGSTGRPFAVALTVNETTQPAQVVGPLAPGARAEVTFIAPRCTPGSRVRFVVDAAGQVEESDEQANVLERTCRAAVQAGT
jgi:hypothetical protein